MQVTIFHNPACGTSRAVLALVREAGFVPQVVEYLKTPPGRDEVRRLAIRSGQPLRALLREKAPPYADLGLDNPDLTDDQILDAIAAHPILLNRPIVETDKGVRLCRPKELIMEIL
jgi:arsenate reductase